MSVLNLLLTGLSSDYEYDEDVPVRLRIEPESVPYKPSNDASMSAKEIVRLILLKLPPSAIKETVLENIPMSTLQYVLQCFVRANICFGDLHIRYDKRTILYACPEIGKAIGLSTAFICKNAPLVETSKSKKKGLANALFGIASSYRGPLVQHIDLTIIESFYLNLSQFHIQLLVHDSIIVNLENSEKYIGAWTVTIVK